MNILLVGLNHKTAPVQVRERLAFDKESSLEALKHLKQKCPECEFVLLSTCNRVELYIAVEKNSKIPPTDIIAALCRLRNTNVEDVRKYLYVMRNQHAVRHLLTVTASLDSMVIGENQISSQVRESYAIACDAKSSGKVLNHLFHGAFATSKNVFTQTSISNRRVSVAGVAVELSKQLFENIKSAKIVVLGAGEMSELLVEHFLHVKCDDITVVNRTAQRGCSLASRHGIKSATWDELDGQLIKANILVGAASANQGYLLDKKKFSKIMSKRHGKTLLAIDITVPRSFDPTINKLENAYLYCIDDLSQVVEKNIKLREGDLEKAVEIICQGVSDYMDWFATREIGPLIGQMKNAFEQIRIEEMEKFFVGQRQEACCKEMMNATVSRVVNKFLYCVIRNVNHVAVHHGPEEAVSLAKSIIEHAETIIDDDKQKG